MLMFMLVRPQDLNPALAPQLPTLNTLALLAVAGWVLDVRRLNSRSNPPPSLSIVGLYMTWCLISLLPNRPDTLTGALLSLFVIFLVYFVIAFGCQSFRKLGVVAVAYLVGGLFITFVVLGQGFGPMQCFESDPRSVGSFEELRPDGRPCETALQCRGEDAEPGKSYLCNKLGPFQTSAVGVRVRYVGRLNDPNETSLAVALIAPIAMALYELRRTLRRWLLMMGTILGVALAVYFSQSRGGQLVFAAVFATYLYRKSGIKGLIVAALMAMPLMLFGGRSGDEAEESSQERLECWLTGMELFRASPIYGIGAYRFTDHHFLTAHNSYVLAVAETGFVGVWLFIGMLYASGKSLVMGLQLADDGSATDYPRRTWGSALLAAFIGNVVGIFFLSFAYHFVLWTFLGICGAYYGAVKAHRPDFEVRLKRLDLYAITAITLFVVAALYFYTKYKSR